MSRSVGWAPLTFLLGVLTGTGSAITIKVLYGLQSTNSAGELAFFEKPLFLTWLMFLAMSLAMPLHWIKEWYVNRDADCSRAQAASRTSWRTLFLMLVPTGFDLAATALAAAGLLYTTVSVYQLVRCSVMIVTALLKATVLRQALTRYMWIGIGINTIAMIIISSISFIPDHAEQQPGAYKDPRIGIALILLSCLVQGAQYVFEEKLMDQDEVAPLVVVGLEGAWGALLMPLIVFPWASMLPGQDVGHCMENVYDSWVMIQNSQMLQIMVGVNFSFVFLYNIFAIYVTYLLSSVWHAILENFRPGAIWMVDLLLYYAITSRAFGEAWTRWSWIELAGMCVMILGTAVYKGSIRVEWAGCVYEEEQEETQDEPAVRNKFIGESTTPLTASPLIQRSLAREHRPSGLSFMSIQNLAPHAEEETEPLTRSSAMTNYSGGDHQDQDHLAPASIVAIVKKKQADAKAAKEQTNAQAAKKPVTPERRKSGELGGARVGVVGGNQAAPAVAAVVDKSSSSVPNSRNGSRTGSEKKKGSEKNKDNGNGNVKASGGRGGRK